MAYKKVLSITSHTRLTVHDVLYFKKENPPSNLRKIRKIFPFFNKIAEHWSHCPTFVESFLKPVLWVSWFQKREDIEHLSSILVFCVCHNKLPQTWWLKSNPSQLWCPRVWNKEQQDHTLEKSREEASPASSRFWWLWAFLVLWLHMFFPLITARESTPLI